MDNNSNSSQNNENNIKIDISESFPELSNSIEKFNKNINRMDKVLNSKNDINTNSNIINSNQNIIQNLKSSTESEIVDDNSSMPINNNRYNNINLKYNNIPKKSASNKKLADPSSDLLCQKLQQKIDTLTYDNFALSKKNKDLIEQNKQLNYKVSSVSHAKETEMQIADEELNNMQNKLKRKEDDMLILEDKIKQYENNLKDFEKNKKNILEIKAENDKINNNNKKLNETIINLEKNLEFYKNKFNDISSKYDILRKDKESINRETIIQKDKNKELNIENENIKNEIKLLNEEKAQLIKKIKDYDMIKKKEFNDLINQTKEQLEKKQKEDFKKMENNLNNLTKIQIQSLEEQNEELKNKIQEMKESQGPNINKDIIFEENKKQISIQNDEISYLKLQLQLKDSENKRLNRIYSENISLIKELNNENNSYKEKIKLLTNKLNEVTTNNYEEINNVRDKLNCLNIQNRLYEEQDKEYEKIFTEALLNVEKNNNDEETKNMIIAINQLPKGNNKRISQLTFLANKLKKLSGENGVIMAKLQNALLQNEKYKEESEMYQKMAQNNNEPYEYLLKELAKKDSDLMYYKELVNEKEIRYKAVMKENERLNERYNEIEKDLKEQLENRDKIDKLDYLVGKIVENQKKFLDGEKFDKSGNQLVNKKTYKVGKNEPLKKGKKKYK